MATLILKENKIAQKLKEFNCEKVKFKIDSKTADDLKVISAHLQDSIVLSSVFHLKKSNFFDAVK